MRRSLATSLLLHGLLVAALILSGEFTRVPRYPPVYELNLIAAPPGETLAPPRARPRPEPEREEPPPEEAATPEPEPEVLEEEPELVPEETAEEEPPPEPEPEPAPEGPETEAPPEEREVENPRPDAGGNEAPFDAKVEGRPFPFPGYLERLVAKIGRNWRRTPSQVPRQAVVYFRVERSGRVSGIEVRESSGDFLFDQSAQRAVKDASPLPPLPDGYTGDYLGVVFDFNEENR